VITHSPPVTQKRATPLPEWGLPTLCINGISHLNKNLNFKDKGKTLTARLLAYPSFSYIETMQNGKVDFEEFPME